MGTAENGLDSGVQFAHLERLAEIVVRPEFENEDLVGRVVDAAEQDDGRLCIQPDQGNKVKAVAVRQNQVEKDDIDMDVLDFFQQFPVVAAEQDGVALLLQE